MIHYPDTTPPESVFDLPHAGELPRGATGVVWISGAIRLGDGVIGGSTDTPSNPPRVVHRSTESPVGGKYLESVVRTWCQLPVAATVEVGRGGRGWWRC